jgi:plastocyanin
VICRSYLAAVLAAVLAMLSCSSNDDSSIRPGNIDSTTGPYVSVAVDNHFHDVHPEDHIEVAADRPFTIENQGRNLHNVTFAGLEISKDIRPGKWVTFEPVGDVLGTGTIKFLCKYHDYVGMRGEITVVGKAQASAS